MHESKSNNCCNNNDNDNENDNHINVVIVKSRPWTRAVVELGERCWLLTAAAS